MHDLEHTVHMDVASGLFNMEAYDKRHSVSLKKVLVLAPDFFIEGAR